MDLKAYVDAERGRAKRLAMRLQRSAAFVSQMARGQRPIPAAAARVIEDESGGLVPRWVSRPKDWFELWPDLVNAVGAPPAPSSEVRDAA